MGFVKLHQECADCGSSDALSYNEDGSSYCFACATYTPPESTGGSVSNIQERVVPRTRVRQSGLYRAIQGLSGQGSNCYHDGGILCTAEGR